MAFSFQRRTVPVRGAGLVGRARLISLRTVQDWLREEYFLLLAHARQDLEEIETEVRHCLLPLARDLHAHERLIVTSRIKDCESALAALRRRQEGATFDSDFADAYTLT